MATNTQTIQTVKLTEEERLVEMLKKVLTLLGESYDKEEIMKLEGRAKDKFISEIMIRLEKAERSVSLLQKEKPKGTIKFEEISNNVNSIVNRKEKFNEKQSAEFEEQYLNKLRKQHGFK